MYLNPTWFKRQCSAGRGRTWPNGVPVKHSENLNPSACAIASIILELTVDATMASLTNGM